MATPLTLRPSAATTKRRLAEIGDQAPELLDRVDQLRRFGRTVRNAEIHLTNACNIRCEGCWFFEHDFDKATHELTDLAEIRRFVAGLRAGGTTSALLIGGEPTLVPRRIEAFVEQLDYVTISTNGLRALPKQGFEDVAVAISLFGGGPLDDQLRAIKPGGRRFTGLFETALANYRGDPRANFVYALAEAGLPYIEETVRRIGENGNQVAFNFYSSYGSADPLRVSEGQRLLEEALRVKEEYPDVVVSHPYYIRALITGRGHWGDEFGYDVCPSISVAHPDHAERVANGNPVLPNFSVWAADYRTLEFCCTSGHCTDCRDSQAVFSWLLVSMAHFLDSPARLAEWVGVAESYWRQWYWAPYNPNNPRHGDLLAGPLDQF